jgi:hypothetical protein
VSIFSLFIYGYGQNEEDDGEAEEVEREEQEGSEQDSREDEDESGDEGEEGEKNVVHNSVQKKATQKPATSPMEGKKWKPATSPVAGKKRKPATSPVAGKKRKPATSPVVGKKQNPATSPIASKRKQDTLPRQLKVSPVDCCADDNGANVKRKLQVEKMEAVVLVRSLVMEVQRKREPNL